MTHRSFFLALLLVLHSSPALAGTPTVLPPAAQKVDIDEHLGQSIDGSLSFVDPSGRAVHLADYFHDQKPALLVLAYYRCPMLCDLVLQTLASGMKDLSLELGEDYRVITVSFDPRDAPESAAKKQRNMLNALGAPDRSAAFPFLVGAEEESRALADEIGFRYAYDSQTGEYAHPAVVVALTPEGKISRYLYGVSTSPRDLRLALVEAAHGRVGTILDRVLLTCYRFDPASRRYGPFLVGFLRIGALFILSAVAILLTALFLKDRARRMSSKGRQKP